MHRRPLLELLSRYQPLDTMDTACRDRFVRFVRTNQRCFERDLDIGHVTGSAWIVDAAGARVLLTHHRKLNIWVQPGGHADGDPDIARVARREAGEETALADFAASSDDIFDLDIHRIPARDGFLEHEHFDVRFAFRAIGSDQFTVSDESHDLAWVHLAELEAFTREPSMLRMRDKWLHSLQPKSA